MELVIKDNPDPVGDLIRQLEAAGEWDLVDAIRNHLVPTAHVAVAVETLHDLAMDCDDLASDLGAARKTGDAWVLEDEAESVKSSLTDMRETLRRLANGKR